MTLLNFLNDHFQNCLSDQFKEKTEIHPHRAVCSSSCCADRPARGPRLGWVFPCARHDLLKISKNRKLAIIKKKITESTPRGIALIWTAAHATAPASVRYVAAAAAAASALGTVTENSKTMIFHFCVTPTLSARPWPSGERPS